MKKTLKKPMVAFFIVSLVLIVAWLALLMVIGFVFKADVWYAGLGDYLMAKWNSLLEIISAKAGFAPGGEATWWTSYVVYGVLAIFLAGLIAGIILCIKRKAKRYIPYCIVMLFATIAVLDFAACARIEKQPYLTVFSNLFGGKGFPEISVAGATLGFAYSIFVFIMLICGLLGYIFTVVTYFIGLKHARLELASEACEGVENGEEASNEEAAPAEDEAEKFALPASSDEVKSEEVPAEEATPSEEPAPAYEPMADFLVEPNEVAAQPEEIIVEELPVNADESKDSGKIDANELASMIRDVVRDIVRDEMSRANANKPEDEKPHRGDENRGSITGASFGGPLVVQYFNGAVQSAPAPAAAPAPAPAPVATPAAPAPAPTPAEPAPVPVVAPVVEAAPEAAPAPVLTEEKKPIVRIPFHERLFAADKDMQSNYNELKNEFLSWGLKSRVSNSGDTFRLHRKTYAKLTIAGKSLKLYFALDPKDYADSTIPVQDASGKGIYEEIPLVFKVKSPLSLRRCKQLIQDAVEKDGLEQKEVESVNWVKELKAEMKGK